MVAIISIILSKSTCMIARIYQPIDLAKKIHSAHTLNISYNINPVRRSVSNLFHVMAFLLAANNIFNRHLSCNQ